MGDKPRKVTFGESRVLDSVPTLEQFCNREQEEAKAGGEAPSTQMDFLSRYFQMVTNVTGAHRMDQEKGYIAHSLDENEKQERCYLMAQRLLPESMVNRMFPSDPTEEKAECKRMRREDPT